ncbi:hypothetical protein Mal15_02180 [Stieleria maiorica]|uniref:SGNH hydrolase-type esterase domain-containing protein n=1 Tax=Stieleria maiorica TaxID=2795974 RepID=A0A5B9M516_9BACT|nr:hypothetical protein [Stieleria maiorica]QEF96191.1 hypothetical protein Mal15_02180 [Stieleria maiorica]
MRCQLLLVALSVVTMQTLANAQQVTYPPPSQRGDPATVGRGIQRTMTLLATSTPERRNTVHILLYGQSITAGQWGVRLEEHLRSTYPHANLIYQRKPLSGFSTERLVKTAQADLYPTYADLVIFHDYGNNEDYETMIRKLREQTTSEILIQADHFRRSEQLLDESQPSEIEERRQRWAAERNTTFLPGLARQYGCGFDGRRELWKAYLQEHSLAPGDLVKDDVHPNEHGTYLMTELIKAYLVPRSDTRLDPMNCEYVSTYDIDDIPGVTDDKLVFSFHGNRIDVVFRDDATGSCDVLIDGEKPLQNPTMFYHGRNRVKWRDTPIPPGPWPPVLKMTSIEPIVEETWTLRAEQDSKKPDTYEFELVGSVTGSDGSGRTDKRFVSNSGRVVIAPEDWDVQFSIVALRRLEELPMQFQLDWTVETQARNIVTPPEHEPGIERTITAVQRISDGDHTIELTGSVRGIKALRVYSPKKFPR